MSRYARFVLLSLVLVLVQVPLLPAQAGDVRPTPMLTVSRKDRGPLSTRLATLARAHVRWPGQHNQRAGLALDDAALARALSLPVSGPGSLIANGAGEVLVYIQLASAEPAVLARLEQGGARIVHVSQQYGMVTA